MVRKIIACILTIIYLGFTAGAALHVPSGEVSDDFSVESYYSPSIDVSGKELPDPASHLEVLNFHKSHKHLVASRPFEIQRANLVTTASPIHISSINSASQK